MKSPLIGNETLSGKIRPVLEGSGAVLSAVVGLTYFPVADAYQGSFIVDLVDTSKPGTNVFAFIGVAHLICSLAFILLLVVGIFRFPRIVLLSRLLILTVIGWQLVRIIFMRLEVPSVWVVKYSKTFAWFSEFSLLLIPVLLLLLLLYLRDFVRTRGSFT